MLSLQSIFSVLFAASGDSSRFSSSEQSADELINAIVSAFFINATLDLSFISSRRDDHARMAPRITPPDAILPMTDECMQQIVRGEKTYEFRHYLISPSVKRVWFYLKAPLSHIGYICEIDGARTRNPGDEPLPENGLGNKAFNSRHKDWDKNDYAYRVKSIWRILEPITLAVMKERFGIKAAPRGLIYVPAKMVVEVPWEGQERVSLSSLPSELDEQGSEKDVGLVMCLSKSKRKGSPVLSSEEPKRCAALESNYAEL